MVIVGIPNSFALPGAHRGATPAGGFHGRRRLEVLFAAVRVHAQESENSSWLHLNTGSTRLPIALCPPVDGGERTHLGCEAQDMGGLRPETLSALLKRVPWVKGSARGVKVAAGNSVQVKDASVRHSSQVLQPLQ